MKQKVVIRVSMIDDKSRSKALKTVVGVPGVESVALRGAKRDEVEVVGERIDAAVLTMSLRKNVAYADLISLGEVKKEKDEPLPPSPTIWSYNYPYYYYGPLPSYLSG